MQGLCLNTICLKKKIESMQFPLLPFPLPSHKHTPHPFLGESSTQLYIIMGYWHLKAIVIYGYKNSFGHFKEMFILPLYS